MPLPTTYAPGDQLSAADVNAANTAINAAANTAVTTSVANEVAQFAGTDGKQLKRATASGVAVLNSGVLSASPPATATVATSETTNSSTYVDLTTTTDSVTVTIGPSGMALVGVTAWISQSATSGVGYMAFAVSGATTRAADDADAVVNRVAVSDQKRITAMKLVTGLAAGSNTFKAKYRATGGTATFSARDIFVIPL